MGLSLSRFVPTTLAALAFLAFSPADAAAMSCDNIMDMVNVNVPANIVIETMRSSGATFTSTDVQCLQSKGAPAEVVTAASSMAAVAPAPAPSGVAPAPAAAPGSTFDSAETLGGGTFGVDDSIDDSQPEPSGGGPPVLEQAIEAYRAKKYKTSSKALWDLLQDKTYPDQETKVQYYLAKSLYDMEMYHSAQHYFMEVVRKGPQNPYFKYALPRLVQIAQYTGNDYELLRIVHKIPPEAFPRQAKNHLYYLMGRKLYDKEELAQAAQNFGQVSAKSELYMRSKFYEGVINQQRGKLKSSVMAFREVMKATPPLVGDARGAQEVEDMKDLALINVARIYFGLERFDNADNYYAMVERDSTYWSESLFERAWTNFWRADLNFALGLLLTVQSPYFSDTEYIPEVTILRALTFFNLCEYNEVERILIGFEGKYTPQVDEMKAFLKQYRGQKDLWDGAYDAYFANRHDQSQLQQAAFARLLRNQDLAALVRHLDMMDGEVTLLDNQGSQWSSTIGGGLKQTVEADRLRYKKRAGAELLREMQEQYASLEGLLIQSEIIRFEVVDAQRADYEFLSTNDNVDVGTDRQVDFATSKDIIYWPFNGEFWRDELGYYRYTEHGSCDE